eukprot:363047-Chlamydomonas_euryale.AAC.2
MRVLIPNQPAQLHANARRVLPRMTSYFMHVSLNACRVLRRITFYITHMGSTHAQPHAQPALVMASMRAPTNRMQAHAQPSPSTTSLLMCDDRSILKFASSSRHLSLTWRPGHTNHMGMIIVTVAVAPGVRGSRPGQDRHLGQASSHPHINQPVVATQALREGMLTVWMLTDGKQAGLTMTGRMLTSLILTDLVVY